MKREIVKYVSGRVIPAIVTLVFIILAVRYLGPVEYGRYSLLFYTVLLAVALSFHWVQASISRFLRDSAGEPGVALNRFFYLTVLCALCSTLIVALAGVFLFHATPAALILVILFAFLNHFYLFHQAILKAHNRSVRLALLEGADQLFFIAVFVAGLFLFHWRSSLLIFGSLAVGMAGALTLRFLIRVKGMISIDFRHPQWDTRFSGKVIGFGYRLSLWLFLSHLLMAADRFILLEFFGYHEAGSFSALKDILFKGVMVLTFPIYISYQAKIADRVSSGKKREAWVLTREALSFEVLVFILGFIIFMIVKQPLLNHVLGIPGMENWLVYLPLMISAFLWHTAILLQLFLESDARFIRMILAAGFCVGLNIALNLVFVPRFGITAAALALLASTGCYCLFIFGFSLVLRRKIESEIPGMKS